MSEFTSEQNKEFWNKYALEKKNNPSGAHSDWHLVDLENRFIRSQLESRKATSLLDIGCGNGQRTLMFSAYASHEAIGIDYSSEMIKEAQILLSNQSKAIQSRLSFKVADVQDFSSKVFFDTIISCRCFINQPSSDNQLKLFEILHKKLNKGGSLIIAEGSMGGYERLSLIRNKFGLESVKIAPYNLPIREDFIFPKIKHLFDIQKINRLGLYYYISRVLHPALVHPQAPQADAKINDLAMKAEILIQSDYSKSKNSFEKFGAHLLAHFKKK